MDKIKKVYIDSRYKASGSVSNSDFKFELKEALDLPENTVCYVDDISIPHSWYTIEDYNNKLYVELTNTDQTKSYTVLTIETGNYTGASLAAIIHTTLRLRFIYEDFSCTYLPSKGVLSFYANKLFRIFTDLDAGLATILSVSWVDNNGEPTSVDSSNLMSINDVLRHSTPQPEPSNAFESGFLDLLNTHNIYMHCDNLGHYSTLGVRGENTIIKKVPVSSSFGYLIMDSVVAPHDKIDVSRQLIKTLRFTLKNVHGNVINLHGAHCSFSLIFQTIE